MGARELPRALRWPLYGTAVVVVGVLAWAFIRRFVPSLENTADEKLRHLERLGEVLAIDAALEDEPVPTAEREKRNLEVEAREELRARRETLMQELGYE